MKTAIGLMSGTSMDGIDVALLRTDGEALLEFGPAMAVPYDPAVRDMLAAANGEAASLSDRTARPGILTEAEEVVTDLHASAVLQFLAANDLMPEGIDLIGFHGQTVLHRPDKGLTVQLGDGLRLARATGIDTVHDFRAADMEAGGQGAPLVPVFHRALAHHFGLAAPIAFVNIGGIANVTFIGEDDALLAFDCGPGNALIDQWVQAHAGVPFDQGGAIASEGTALEPLVARYMAHPFLAKPGPKSLDRADFTPLEPAAASLHDGARTLAHITAAAIARSADLMPGPPDRWVVCGGGRRNAAIMADLAAMVSGTVVTSDSLDIEGDMLEAQAFAYLAVRSVQGLPLTFPGTTGVRGETLGGSLVNAVRE